MSGTATTPVLEISGAIAAPRESRLPSVPLDLRVMPGECVLIDASSPSQAREFADLCCGLLPLRSGRARFLDRDWSELPIEFAAALRGRIGRLHGAGSWVSFLTTDTNILLAPLHHTSRAEPVLREMATALSISFGLPGLPMMRPDALTPTDLMRAACVRAFVGEPSLLLLDNPEVERIAELVPALLNALMTRGDRQAASIWLTRGDRLWNDRAFPASMRFRLLDRGLVQARARA